jgi:ABC-type transport system substrate-binding protein
VKRALLGLLFALSGALHAAEPTKVLKLAFRVAETSLDPANIQNLYSRTVTPHIFEALYTYDHLARPAKIVPQLAVGMPEVSADYKIWTVQVRPGIYFADDPAFKGRKREVVAQDIIYAIQRLADPANKSPAWGFYDAQAGLVGLHEVRQAALDTRKRFDYDAPIGLKQWRRASLIVLERNPHFRDEFYAAQPAPDDAEGQAILARFKGRKLPMVDEVRVAIIEDQQPRWLAFLNEEIDFIGGQANDVPPEFITQAARPTAGSRPNSPSAASA